VALPDTRTCIRCARSRESQHVSYLSQ
jgi:hypothetical protein